MFDRLQFRDLARHLFLPGRKLGDAARYLLSGKKVRAGGKLIAVAMVRITTAGRDALGENFP